MDTVMSTPQTFRTSPGSYVVLCGVLSVAPIAATLSPVGFGLTMLLILWAMPVTAAIWFAYFRLRLDEWGIEYRDLFGRNFRVAYAEIAFLKSQRVSTGRGFAVEWILHLHDGSQLRLNLKPFPRDASALLSQRIRCV